MEEAKRLKAIRLAIMRKYALNKTKFVESLNFSLNSYNHLEKKRGSNANILEALAKKYNIPSNFILTGSPLPEILLEK